MWTLNLDNDGRDPDPAFEMVIEKLGSGKWATSSNPMPQLWTIEGRLAGYFIITTQERRNAGSPVVEGLKSLRIEPQFDDQSQYTGMHSLKATIEFQEDSDGDVPAHTVDERAKRMLDTVAALASVGTGRAIQAVEGYSATFRTDDNPPRLRILGGQSQSATFDSPSRLDVAVLAVPLSDRLRRVVRWWARGLASEDTVDQLVSYGNSLDQISSHLDQAPPQVRVCSNCGHETTLRPSSKQKIIYFLETVGVDRHEAAAIYESRNLVSHAGSDLRPEDLYRFADHAHTLSHALHRGIAQELGIEVQAMPEHLPIHLESALVDIQAIGRPVEVSDDEDG